MSGCTVKSMEVQPNPCAKVVYTAHPTAESGRVQRTPAGAVHHAQSAEVGFVGSQRKDHLAADADRSWVSMSVAIGASGSSPRARACMKSRPDIR